MKNADVTIREVYELNQRIEAKLDTAINSVNKDIAKTNERINNLNKQYVSQAEFLPVKALVYGGAGIILTAVLSALVYLVVKQ